MKSHATSRETMQRQRFASPSEGTKVQHLQVLEPRLAGLLREEQSHVWKEENRETMEDYNRRVEAQGTFSDGLRRF